jgi:hypothetical protein
MQILDSDTDSIGRYGRQIALVGMTAAPSFNALYADTFPQKNADNKIPQQIQETRS